MHTQTHSGTQTHRHTDTDTHPHKHTDRQTDRHTALFLSVSGTSLPSPCSLPPLTSFLVSLLPLEHPSPGNECSSFQTFSKHLVVSNQKTCHRKLLVHRDSLEKASTSEDPPSSGGLPLFPCGGSWSLRGLGFPKRSRTWNAVGNPCHRERGWNSLGWSWCNLLFLTSYRTSLLGSFQASSCSRSEGGSSGRDARGQGRSCQMR